MTLYLKYRPTNLDELDLPEVGESLKKIVQSDKIPHAFLFAGPKGTGKTSAARILAKIINCEQLSVNGVPCDKCEQCISITKGTNLDVIEMDAASHRGIDDVRSLRDAVKLSPSKAKKKIYIIDEAHMLTTEASNALLKTLEEPPEHVIFILATTNPEKLIDTIRSRTTLIAFRKAGEAEIARSLQRVIKAEKIKITDDEIKKIAQISNGAFRDAIKILEQFASEGADYLDRFQTSDLGSFIGFLAKKDEKSAISEIEKNVANGVSMESFLSTLLSAFHKDILSGEGEFSTDELITLSELFIEANRNLIDSPIEELPPEIAVLKWCGKKGNSEKIVSNNEEKEEEIKIKEEISMASLEDSIWQKIISEVHPINISIEGLLRSSKPISYDGKTLTLGVYYKFHKERLEDMHHKKILEDVIEKILNCPTRIVCTLVEPPPKTIIEEVKKETILTETKEPDIVKAAEEIFGN